MITNVSSLLNWQDVLQVLGVKTNLNLLPCYGNCPLSCNGILHVIYDYTYDGVWCYCDTCRFKGDLIELATKAWNNISIYGVLNKLALSGVSISEEITPDYITLYEKILRRRAKIDRFWTQARNRLLVDDNTAIRNIMYRLGLRLMMDKERWLDGPGLNIGSSTRKEVELTFRSSVSAGKVKIFPNSTYNEVVVFPSYDLPNRIRGFICVGREGNVAKDVVYAIPTGVHNQPNTGLALYNTAQHIHDTIFIMDDPILAVQLQAWHLQDNSVPLPIVSLVTTPSYSTNNNIWMHSSVNKIFWGKPSVQLFKHARACNAQVCTAGFTENGPEKTFIKKTLSSWLIDVKEKAKAWDTTLELLLGELSHTAIEEILVGIGLTNKELQEFQRVCPDNVKASIDCCIDTKPVKTITLDTTVIKEGKNWAYARRGSTISDAILRIDEVILDRVTNLHHCIGRVLYENQEIPFKEEMSVLESRTDKWLRDKVLLERGGYPYVDKRFANHYVTIANKFHPPVIREAYSKLGWNERDNVFVFSSFKITRDGEIKDDYGLTSNLSHLTSFFKKPTTPTKSLIDSLPSGYGSKPFWSMLACVIHNIIAPIYSEDPVGICIVNDTGVGKQTAACLGCDLLPGWPTTINRKKCENLHSLLLADGPKNYIHHGDEYEALVLGMSTNWNIIHDKAEYPSDIKPDVAELIPLIIHDLAKKKFSLPYMRTDIRIHRGTTARVLKFIANWYNEQGGDVAVVLGADDILSSCEESFNANRIVTNFIELIHKFYITNEVAAVRDKFTSREQAHNFITFIQAKDDDPDYIFVPKSLINNILTFLDKPCLKSDNITAALKSEGVGKDYIYKWLTGWVIKEDVWNERVESG